MIPITAQIVVKNEDHWVWFALQSILPFVEEVLLVDTGSSDRTVEVVKTINSKKIKLYHHPITSPLDLTRLRQEQVEKTKTDWFWLVDGDEVYPRKTAEEIVSAITQDKYEGIVVRRYDLLGDIYHRQRESVGSYNLFGHRGHLVTRLLNKRKIPGLHVIGKYPLEGYFDLGNISTRDRDAKKYYITENYLYHAMYLKRSSRGSNLKNMLNRSKYKIEKGMPIDDDLPEVFSLPHPSLVPDPFRKRGMLYEVAAQIITPIKEMKRAVL